MKHPEQLVCPCGGEYTFSVACGAFVCPECDDHLGMSCCFCGWAADGGDGQRQLIEMGEQIEEDY